MLSRENKPTKTSIGIVPLVGLLLLASLLKPSPAWSEPIDPSSPCSVEIGNFTELLDVYQASPRKTGSSYRSLLVAYREALKGQKECIKAIDLQFKREIKAIKAKFDAMKSDPQSKREVLEAQKRNEITAASLRRDEAIKSLTPIPEIPSRPKPRK